MLPLTKSDGEEFLSFLLLRLDRAKQIWDAAKKSQSLKLELSLDMPSTDGALARQQASGNRELATYAEALKDYNGFLIEGKWREDLMQEWLNQRKKPMGAAQGDRAKRQQA